MATIKKIILLALTVLVMIGCDIKQSDGIYKPHYYRTYIIDSCEYVGYAAGYQGNYLAHKGNCRFCKERRQKELEELVIKLKEGITVVTVKNYTDLEQSKKLAEILPLESADMCFTTRNNMPPLMTPYSRFDEFFNMGPTPSFLIPCWSLAALLEQIPSDIKGNNLMIRKSYWQVEKTFAYELLYGEDFEGYSPSILVSTSSIELIDACYEMILKLHELNLL